jgi:uncharacterized surface protein with fasciclin (FAS1) repeats
MNKLLSACALAVAMAGAPAFAETVAEKVAAHAELSTLAAALTETGLMANLEGAGPVTLFAPTNAAFAALPADARAAVADPEKLTDVLLYHVVEGEYDTGALKGSEVGITMANGAELVGIAEGGVTIQGGSLVEADIRASNGVIHVIDKVLLARE